MSKIILGLDMDGVLYDFHDSLFIYYQYELNYQGTYEQFWMDYIPSLSKERQDLIMEIPIPYETRVAPKEVISFLEYASDNVDELFYITHRPLSLERITRRYLRRSNFPFQDNLFMTGDKLTTSRYLGVTHFLDDHVKHVKSVGTVADAYLMAKPWNKEFHESLPTVKNLREFQDRVFV